MSSPDGIGMVLLDNPDAQGKVEMNVSWNFGNISHDTFLSNLHDKFLSLQSYSRHQYRD